MQEAHRTLKHGTQDIERRILRADILLVIEACLRQLDVPVAELAPQELVDRASRLTELVVLEVRRHVARRLLHAREDPAVGECIVLRRRHERCVRSLEIHQHIARGIPYLVRKIARRLDALPVEAHVVAGRIARDEHEAERIRTVLFNDLHGVDAVAEGLRHLAPLAVAHESVDKDIAERHIAAEAQPHHDHACHPEEDDVIARHEHRRRVEMAQIDRLLRPAECLERPEAGAEPRIEHVLILVDVRAAAVRARREVVARHGGLATVRTVPCGDAVSPPELARDAPVTNIFKPVFVDFRETLGDKADPAVTHRLNRGLREALHADEPLLRYERLDRCLAARAVSNGVLMLFRAHEGARFLELLHECLAARIAVHPRIASRVLVHRAIGIDDDDLLKIVPLSHFKVVRIVRGRHLDCARSEGRIDVGIGKERDAASHHGQDQRLADECLVPLIIGMYRHARIAEHRLGARRRDLHIVVRALNRIAQMPEVSRLRLMLDLDVRDRRHAGGAPVCDARPLIDQALLIETDKDLAHGAGTSLVHREPLAVPVTGCAEHPQLIHDAVAVLLLPVPDTREELLSAEVKARRALLAQCCLHLCLRCDARMVAARDPDHVLAAHSLVAHEDVLQRIVEGVSHVELPRHVRRRDHHAVRRTALVCLVMKELMLLPVVIPFPLKALWVVCLWNIGTGFLTHRSIPPERNALVPRGRRRPLIYELHSLE